MRRHTSTLRLAHGLNISNKEALAMAWKLYKSYRDGVCEIREYLCDTASDIANLPSDTGNGSLAYLVAEKKTQICNGGIWHDYLPYQVSKRDIDELDTKINGINIKNGTGGCSLIQANVSGFSNTATFEHAVAFGKNNKATNYAAFVTGTN